VSFFIWCDDFSAARNESLRACTKDWIFVLDADERIAPQDVQVIRSLADEPTNSAFRFTTRNYTNTTSVSEFETCAPGDPCSRGFSGWYPSSKVRFFPNRVGARFVGKVHELVHESLLQRSIRIQNCNAPIHHYAWLKDPKRMLQKQELYLQLGHEKIKEDPENPAGYAELGNQYAEIHDFAHAAAAYREAVKRDSTNPLYLKDLGGVLHLINRDDDAKTALKVALQLDPSLVDAWRNLGVIYADEKEWAMAVECFEQGLAQNENWPEGLKGLSVSLAGAGRVAEAAAAVRKALELNPASTDYLQLYIHHMLRLEKRSEARDFLNSLLAQEVQYPELFNALGELSYYDNLFDEAAHFFQRACESGYAPACNNLGVVLYRQKDFPQARQAFERCLRIDPEHRGARVNLEKTIPRT
jgi:tetratricopeptide (TPR) repeat protein